MTMMNNPDKMILCFTGTLRKAGIKLTHQRLEIIRNMVCSKGHPSVGEVFEAVREKVPSLSLDTVYRTMRMLSGLGLIHPVGSSSERIRFDLDHNPHHHFLCAVCGEAYDFVCPELDRIQVPEEARAIGVVRGTRIEVRGVCRSCLEKEERSE